MNIIQKHLTHSVYKSLYPIFIGIACCLLITACSEDSGQTQHIIAKNNTTILNNNELSSGETNNNVAVEPDAKIVNYKLLQKDITYGRATLAQVYNALSQKDAGALTNTVHALYNMRWHRGVYNVLNDMWANNIEKHPDFAWDLIQNPPVRIALANTINRIKIINTDEYVTYIRSFKQDEHEFHRAQVVIALGFNGETSDIEYIKSMANGSNHYVAQSAITALALMDSIQARDAMADLWKGNRDTEKGILIKTLLKKAYNVEPSLTPPQD